jgi:hypothetical protein
MTAEDKQELKAIGISFVRRMIFLISEIILWPTYVVSVLICWITLFPSFLIILVLATLLVGTERSEMFVWRIFSHRDDVMWYDEGVFEDCSDPSHDGRFLSFTPMWGPFVHACLYDYFEEDI